MAENAEWEVLKGRELVPGRKVRIASKELLGECLQRSKLLQKARDEGALRTLVGLFAGQTATVIEAPLSSSVLEMEGMCKIRTSVGTTASLPIGSLGKDLEAERQLKLKYEQNAAHDIAASELQDVWRKSHARKHAVIEVQDLRNKRDALLLAQRDIELMTQLEMVKDLAVVTIQSFLRGCYTRRILKPDNNLNLINKKKQNIINNNIKENEKKMKDPEVIKAATVIGSHVRGTLVRRASSRRHKSIKDAYEKHNQDKDNEEDVEAYFHLDLKTLPLQKEAYLSETISNDKCPQFLDACTQGDLHHVHILFRDEGININCADSKGNNGILCACPGGHIDIIKYLLSVGGSLLLQNFNGWTPLHRACFYGKFDLVEYIIETLAKQGSSNGGGGGGSNNASDLNPLSLGNHLGATPLHVAIPNGHINICEKLLQCGSNLKTKNGNGDTPLSFAVICRKPELASLFLQHDPSTLYDKNNDGLTPYEIADKMKQYDLATMLNPSNNPPPPSNSLVTNDKKQGRSGLREDLARSVAGHRRPDSDKNDDNGGFSGYQEGGDGGGTMMYRGGGGNNDVLKKKKKNKTSSSSKSKKQPLDGTTNTFTFGLNTGTSSSNKDSGGSGGGLFRPLEVEPSKLNNSSNRISQRSNKKGGGRGGTTSKILKEDTKVIDKLLQNCSAVWSRRELIRRAWLASCPICHEIQMTLPEVHTILHVLGIIPTPPSPQKPSASDTQSLVSIRLDTPEHTTKDLSNALSQHLGHKSSGKVSFVDGATTRSKLLSLIRCPKGALLLIAERKRVNDWGEGTGKSLLQRLDIPDSTIRILPCKGIDLLECNVDTIYNTSPMLKILPSVIKKRLLFHCEILRMLTELESSKVLHKINKTSTTKDNHKNNINALFEEDNTSSIQNSVDKDIMIDEGEAGGWVTPNSFKENDDIQVSHFEELAMCMSAAPPHSTLSEKELKIARRTASSKGKLVKLEDGDMASVILEDGFQTKLPLRGLYHIPTVLTPAQLYVGANARVVKAGWLRQLLLNHKNGKQTPSSSNTTNHKVLTYEDNLLVDRFGGALVVVSNIDRVSSSSSTPSVVGVKAADGYEGFLPIDALTPPPMDAAMKLLFRNSVTLSEAPSEISNPNFDQSISPQQKSKSSKPRAQNNKQVINLHIPQMKSSETSGRPLYREVHDDDNDDDDNDHKIYANSMNRVPYVPDRMLRDGRVADQLGRGGVKGTTTTSKGTTTTRPHTANAKLSSQSSTRNNTTAPPTTSKHPHQQTHNNTFNHNFTKFDDHSEADMSSGLFINGGSKTTHSNNNKTTRPKSASVSQRHSHHGHKIDGGGSWESVNVQTFDFGSVQPEKVDRSLDKPDFKFGISGGVRKSLDSTFDSKHSKHSTSRVHQNHHHSNDHHHSNQSNQKPHQNRHPFIDHPGDNERREGSHQYNKTMNTTTSTNTRNKKNDRKESMSRRPASAGAVRPKRGLTTSHEWSFGGSRPESASGGGLASTFRTTQTRQTRDDQDERGILFENDIYDLGFEMMDTTRREEQEEVDEEIKSHVENLIDEHSGRWDLSGAQDTKLHSARLSDIEDNDDMFKEQLDRMEQQMANKEAQIRDAIKRQKQSTKEMNQERNKIKSKNNDIMKKHRKNFMNESKHRKKREELFKNDIAKTVDELIENEKQTWNESDYYASELALALDQMSERLSKDKGIELEIRRKLKQLSKKLKNSELKVSEIHNKMGNIKMSKSDSLRKVIELENMLIDLNDLNMNHGKEIKKLEDKLNSIIQYTKDNINAIKSTSKSNNLYNNLDKDAQIIHSIELKSSLMKNRRKELLESLDEAHNILKVEERKYEDHTNQLTIVDVAVKAMKSVVGKFAATSN